MLSGFLGGLVGAVVLNPHAVEATIARGSFFDASFYNKGGQMAGYVGSGDAGQGMIFLFDAQGKPRIQAGTYAAGSEKGQGLIGISDRSDHLRFLFRLNGSNDSPTLIMKDKSGQDKIVIGLDGETQVPYFYYADQNGRSKNLLK
jgi:hypothetical protein